jgi:3D (Asp-Asp-Asp) domain-containing protein
MFVVLAGTLALLCSCGESGTSGGTSLMAGDGQPANGSGGSATNESPDPDGNDGPPDSDSGDASQDDELVTIPIVQYPPINPIPKPTIPQPLPNPALPQGDGTYLGKFKWTHYYIVFEGDHPGIKNTKIVDWENCSTIATVSKAFYDKVAMEGTGYLSDGRMINLYGSCPSQCNMAGYKCFNEVDTSEAPFGHGSHDNPLRPYRSVAVDVTVVPFWTKLYVPALVGLTMPDENGLDPSSPFIHDGCVTAEDEGSSITGKHLDFFALTEADDDIIDVMMADFDEVDVYRDSPKCQ